MSALHWYVLVGLPLLFLTIGAALFVFTDRGDLDEHRPTPAE